MSAGRANMAANTTIKFHHRNASEPVPSGPPRMGYRVSQGELVPWDSKSEAIWNDFVNEMLEIARRNQDLVHKTP